MFASQLPEANAALDELVDQMQDDKTADPALRDEAREALANVAVLHDLADAARGAWRRRVGARDRRAPARPTACSPSRPKSAGDQTAAKRHREDLESAIRLARLDVGELQGLDHPQAVPGLQERPVQEAGQEARQETEQQR